MPACDAFQNAGEASPQSFAAWFHLALGAHYAGDSERACVALHRAGQLRPKNLWVVWLRGELIAAAGESSQVCDWVSREEARFLGRPALQLRVGHLLMRVGQVDRGREWIEQACARIRWGDGDRALGTCFEWRPGGRIVCPERALLLAGPPAIR